jgi:hypothetical protein
LAPAIFGLALALLWATPARAQSQIHGLVGTDHHGGFGWSIASSADLNSDGVGDFIIGAPAEDNAAGGLNAGNVYLVSGLDGNILAVLPGTQPNQEAGFSVRGLDDVTGSGIHEVLVGSPGADRVLIQSIDGTVVRVLAGQPGSRFGSSVASIGDQNGDGFRDVLVGAPFHFSGPAGITGAVFMFCGATGMPLGDITPPAPDGQFGFCVAPAGDHDGDSVPDIIVGSPDLGGTAGAVFVFKGGAPLQGTILEQAIGATPGDALGASVSRLNDISGDGVPEVLAGAPGSGGGKGKVVTFSGSGMAMLSSFTDSTALALGASVAGTEDLDGDGLDDYITGAPNTPLGNDPAAGRMYVISGATASPIYKRNGRGPQDLFGFSVAKGRDYNGDGFDDVLVGAPHASAGQGVSLGDEGRGDAYSGFDDCNNNGIPDGLELGSDCNSNGILDECEEDCNGNAKPDECDLADGTSSDDNGNGIPDDCECTESNTCSTSPNSSGSGSIMSSSGTKSIAANDLTLVATGATPTNFGIFFYGSSSIQAPLGNGFLCVGSPQYRLPVISADASGTASYLLDNTAPPSSGGLVTAFSTWYFQYWYRDPTGGGAAYNFSDSLKAAFCP